MKYGNPPAILAKRPRVMRRRYHEIWRSGVIVDISVSKHPSFAGGLCYSNKCIIDPKPKPTYIGHPIKKTKTYQSIWDYQKRFNRSSVPVCSGVWCDAFLILNFTNWGPTRCARGWPWDHHLSANVVSDAGLEILNYSTSGAGFLPSTVGWSN